MVEPDPLSILPNYRRLSDNISTAGQPSSEQFQAIAKGFEVVVNLGLKDGDYALADEQGLVESLGLVYESIPVIWEQPTQQDFERFVDCMNRHEGRKRFIHCAANKRVAVFAALFRIREQGLPPDEELRELETVWKPNEIWRSFIVQILNSADINIKY